MFLPCRKKRNFKNVIEMLKKQRGNFQRIPICLGVGMKGIFATPCDWEGNWRDSCGNRGVTALTASSVLLGAFHRQQIETHIIAISVVISNVATRTVRRLSLRTPWKVGAVFFSPVLKASRAIPIQNTVRESSYSFSVAKNPTD